MPHADLTLPGAPPVAAFEGLQFNPGHIERRFVVPPRGASWATICVRARAAPRCTEVSNSVVYMVHATQLLPHTHIGRSSSTTRVTMGIPATGGGGGGGMHGGMHGGMSGNGAHGAAAANGGAGAGGAAQPSTEYVKSLACEGGVTMELAIAQWWMSLGDTTLDVSVEFLSRTRTRTRTRTPNPDPNPNPNQVEFFGVQPSAAPLLLDGCELH